MKSMDKLGFLEILRQRLLTELPAHKVQSHIDYYTSYINKEISSGRAEADVMEELGDPRLIAKTIIDSENNSGSSQHYERQEYEESTNENRNRRNPGVNISFNNKPVNMTLIKVVLAIVAVLLVVVIFAVIFLLLKVFGVIMSILAPVILVIIILSIIFQLIKRR